MNKFFPINSKVFLIAEIGINHNGSIRVAKELIGHAKKSGFDAVKFQTYNSNFVSPKNLQVANYQKSSGFKTMNSLLKKYQLTFDNFKYLKEYCKKIKIKFLSTPFDIESAKFLNSIDVKIFKISSGDLDNFHLLNEIKKFNKPIILSTGLAKNNNQIKKTLKFLNYNRKKIALLHCVSQYPVDYKYSNLSKIIDLKKFKMIVGYSDHTLGNLSSVISVALGAQIIEKHITLDKRMKGPDHKASLEKSELKSFVKEIRETYEMINIKEKLVLTDIKKLVSRKLFFFENLSVNTKINKNHIIALRSNVGIPSRNFKEVIGRKLNQNVQKYEIITRKKISNF